MKLGLMCFIFCITMASSIDVVMKLASFQMNPFQLVFWRFLLGGCFCLPMALVAVRRKFIRFSLSVVAQFLLSGCICVVLSTGLYQIAISIGRASIVSILYCCNPLFVAVLAWAILGEKVSKEVAVASIFYAGSIAVILFSRGEQTSTMSCVFTLLASALLSLYNLLGQRWVDRYPPVVYVAFSFLVGALELLLLAGLSHLPQWIGWAEQRGLEVLARIPLVDDLSWSIVPSIFYIGVIATGLNYLAMQIATKELGANTTAMIFYFKLILAPLLAWIVLGENLEWSTVWSIILIFIAIACKMSGTMLDNRKNSYKGYRHH